MLKRIDVKHLRVGMYLHELCGKYMDHPFWRSKFMLEDKHAIDQLLSSPIKEVVIDTEKGLDVAVIEPRKPAPAPPPSKKAVAHSSLKEEMEHAANVCNKAKHAVTSMFNELRMGSALDANNAVPIVEEISQFGDAQSGRADQSGTP